MSTARPLGFVVANVMHGDKMRAVARFQCVECGELGDVPLGDRALNPEARTKDIVARGWRANVHKKAGTYCPRCAGPAPKNDPDSKLSKVITMALPQQPVPIKEASAEQRIRIRNMLDKSFDDSVGAYLDGMSDQRIAETVGVPRVVVERIRDTAYGPIKVDPEISAMRADLAALKADIDKLQSKAMEIGSRLEKKSAA